VDVRRLGGRGEQEGGHHGCRHILGLEQPVRVVGLALQLVQLLLQGARRPARIHRDDPDGVRVLLGSHSVCDRSERVLRCGVGPGELAWRSHARGGIHEHELPRFRLK